MTNNPVYEFFIQPILQNGWFNPVNTTVYALVLVAAVFLVYRLLKKMHIKIDKYFLLAILPFIFWGSTTRVLHDAAFAGALSTPELNAFYNSPIFPTPGSYLITFMLALIVILISLVIQRFTAHGIFKHRTGIPYWKVMFVIGVALSAVNVWLLPITDFMPLLLILTITAFWILLFFAVYRVSQTSWFRKQNITHLFSLTNQGILGVHLFDASATFTALSVYGYLEQHVVPNIVIPLLGPVSMFLLKIVVVLPVLWIIDRYGEQGNFNNFLKIIIIILGLAPGLRDTVRLMVMV